MPVTISIPYAAKSNTRRQWTIIISSYDVSFIMIMAVLTRTFENVYCPPPLYHLHTLLRQIFQMHILYCADNKNSLATLIANLRHTTHSLQFYWADGFSWTGGHPQIELFLISTNQYQNNRQFLCKCNVHTSPVVKSLNGHKTAEEKERPVEWGECLWILLRVLP